MTIREQIQIKMAADDAHTAHVSDCIRLCIDSGNRTTFINGFLKGAELALKLTGWQAVAKKKPENNTRVFIKYDDGTVDSAFFDNGFFVVRFGFATAQGLLTCCPVFWMYEPKLPEEGK